MARFKNVNCARQANDKWRPFVATITKSEHRKNKSVETDKFCPSQAAIKGTFTALSSFYEYLIQENLVEPNPVALIKQKSKFIRKDHLKPVVRRISTLFLGKIRNNTWTPTIHEGQVSLLPRILHNVYYVK